MKKGIILALMALTTVSASAQKKQTIELPSWLSNVKLSGKLIAFTDHRYHNKDIGGGRHLDIVMKTSMDKGATWSSPEQMVAKGGNGIATSFDCAHGDAAVVVDKKSGRILLMCASGGIGYWESKRGNLLMMGRYYSDDEGKTWYGEEVTKQIYDLMPEVESAFFTSGRICQSKQIKVGKYYRIYTVTSAATFMNMPILVIC